MLHWPQTLHLLVAVLVRVRVVHRVVRENYDTVYLQLDLRDWHSCYGYTSSPHRQIVNDGIERIRLVVCYLRMPEKELE